MALRWKRKDAYHSESSCGRYRVARALVGGVERFECWRLLNGHFVLLPGGPYDTGKHAGEACERDLEARGE